MKRVKVLIPFHLKASNTDCVPGDEIEVSDEQLANIRAVNVNMVLVLGEIVEEEHVAEAVKPKAKKSKKQ